MNLGEEKESKATPRMNVEALIRLDFASLSIKLNYRNQFTTFRRLKIEFSDANVYIHAISTMQLVRSMDGLSDIPSLFSVVPRTGAG